MQEEWCDIEEFDGYGISNYGRVWSMLYDREMKQRFNNTGVWSVWFSKEGAQYARSVSLLVAKHWLPEPEREDFITPIHLDGDRANCRVDNLQWRPRWFAIAFHRERIENPFPDWCEPIEILETGEVFSCPRECSLKYGMLERDIYTSITNEKVVFPQWFNFRYAQNTY